MRWHERAGNPDDNPGSPRRRLPGRCRAVSGGLASVPEFAKLEPPVGELGTPCRARILPASSPTGHVPRGPRDHRAPGEWASGVISEVEHILLRQSPDERVSPVPWDAWAILGDPAAEFVLGTHFYTRYPNYGIDVVWIDEDSRVVAICRIPPRIPATLPEAVRRDVRDLQGAWAPSGDGEQQGASMVFDGNVLTICGGGMAPSVCFRIDPGHSPKTMHFYLPDPDDDRAWHRQRDLPTKAIYRVDGDRLQLWFDGKNTKHEPADKPSYLTHPAGWHNSEGPRARRAVGPLANQTAGPAACAVE